MVKDNTLYDRLNVSPSADSSEILKNYKKLALKYHPDKNPDDSNAHNKLQEIIQAKEILCDGEKRKLYDAIGMDILNNNMGQPNINPEDIFNMFNSGFPNMQKQTNKENIVINQDVTLDDIYNETPITVLYKQKHYCPECDSNTIKCNQCDGKGIKIQVIQMGPMIQQIQTPCSICNGVGIITDYNKHCKICNGHGYFIKDVRINLPLKNGLSNGQQMQITGHGHHLKDGKTDLIIIIKEINHPVFKRHDNDLCITIDLKLYQALYGYAKIIEHLDKRKLYINSTEQTPYGTIKRIPSEGMKILNNSCNKGDLIIKFTISFPQLDNPAINTQLLNSLKILDNDEVNKETIIKNNKSNYIPSILLNCNEDPFPPQQPTKTNHNSQQFEHDIPQFHHMHSNMHSNMHPNMHQQQCVHQ